MPTANGCLQDNATISTLTIGGLAAMCSTEYATFCFRGANF